MTPATDGSRGGSGGGSGDDWASPWDDALQRLEALLHRLPEDRALPPLDEIVAGAELPEGFLREDDRARKLLHEAIVVRPLAHIERVGQLRTEVELLTLEVELLLDRLGDLEDPAEASRAVERIDEVRARLSDIRRLL